MMDDADPGWFDVQQLFHLPCGEGRDRDDQVGTLGGGAGLRGEALAEIGSRVVARHHEQIVEGGDACGGDGRRRDAGSIRETDRRMARDSPRAAGGRRWREDDRRTSAGSGAGDSRTGSELRDERAPGRTGFHASIRRRRRDLVPGCRWRRERFSISQHSGFRRAKAARPSRISSRLATENCRMPFASWAAAQCKAASAARYAQSLPIPASDDGRCWEGADAARRRPESGAGRETHDRLRFRPTPAVRRGRGIAATVRKASRVRTPVRSSMNADARAASTLRCRSMA